MASYTYPLAAPSGELTKEQVHLILSRPSLIARRLADITSMGFVADYLLRTPLDATGGGVFYESGEPAFAVSKPEPVAPNGEYPKANLSQGDVLSAKTVKWGIETDVTDEKIAREGISVLDRALARISNSIIQHVDSTAWGVIASQVTSTVSSSAWTTPGTAVKAITKVRQERAQLGTGIDLNTVVLSAEQYGNVLGMLVDAKVLPSEGPNLVLDGTVPVNALGLTWVTSPHVTGTDPWLVDPALLGGMANEKIGGPDYSAVGSIEARTARGVRDNYEVRGRRVTVPVVLEPLAGVRITGAALS